jgi:nucleotide-binding universal stress UspA family protein
MDSGASDWRRVNAARALLCVDGGAPPDHLLGAALLAESLVWLPTHIVDTRGRRDLGLLRGSITGAGPLSRGQQQAIDAATAEHTRAILDATEACLRRRGLPHAPPQIRVGEPGREICAVAAAVGASLVVLCASRRPRDASGPHSVGHTARFVFDHATCPVLLVRGNRAIGQPPAD